MIKAKLASLIVVLYLYSIRLGFSLARKLKAFTAPTVEEGFPPARCSNKEGFGLIDLIKKKVLLSVLTETL